MQSGSSEQFDPYLGWLGISPDERPPNHYRLLGLRVLEADPVVIRAAADERMALVRKYQTGPKAPYTQQLLNDLASAKLCLLNPDTKAVYDSGLLRTTSDKGRDADTYAPLAADFPPAVDPPPEHDSPHDMLESGQPEPFYVQSWFMAVLATMVLLLGGAILVVGILMNRPRPTALNSNAAGGGITKPNTDDDDRGDELPVMVFPEATGEIQLTAASASLEGQLRFAVRGGEGAIIRWTSAEDLARWRFKAINNGIYRVEIEYAIAEDAEGGEIELRIGDQKKVHSLSQRGGPGQFVTDELFLTVARSGENQLAVRPITPTDQGLLALRALRLIKR